MLMCILVKLILIIYLNLQYFTHTKYIVYSLHGQIKKKVGYYKLENCRPNYTYT